MNPVDLPAMGKNVIVPQQTRLAGRKYAAILTSLKQRNRLWGFARYECSNLFELFNEFVFLSTELHQQAGLHREVKVNGKSQQRLSRSGKRLPGFLREDSAEEIGCRVPLAAVLAINCSETANQELSVVVTANH